MSSSRVVSRRDDAGRFAYKAFISYSHAADGELAASLQAALQRFAKPWHQRRAMRVFRDTTGLTVTPDLWDAIRDSLEASEYFILLASERAAQSRWVELELETWLTIASPDRVLIVWTDGDLVWDHASGDFDWRRTTCLHPRLQGVFDAEPLHLDLRWARTADDLSPRRPEFLDAVARLSATLRAVPFDDLIGEDIRQHKRTRRLAASAITGLVVLLVSSLIAARLAVQQRDAARRRLVELTVTSGAREIERGDLSAAALWFVQALDYENSAGERDLHRLRVRNALNVHPALLHVWTADASVQARWVAFSRDARYLLSDGFREDTDAAPPPSIWDVDSGEAGSFATPGRRLLAVDAIANHTRILTADSAGALRVLDARTGAELARLPDDADVRAATFSNDGATLFTQTANTVRIWNAADARLRHTLEHESELIHAAFTGDGRRIVSSTVDSMAHVWTLDSAAGTVERDTIRHPEDVQFVDASSDGRFVVTIANGDARLFDLTAEADSQHVTSWPFVNHAEFSPDGSLLLIAALHGETTVFALDPLRELAVARHEGIVLHAAFSPDGESFATASNDRVARVWSARDGEPQTPPLFHEGTVTHVAFTADNARLATATAEGLVRVWQVRATTRALRHEYVNRAEFHPNGRYLLTIGDADVKLWDLQRDTAITLATQSQVYHAGFSPDGRRLVTCEEAGNARIWDVATGQELMSLQHERRVEHASFHPSRPWLITAGASNTRAFIRVVRG